MKTEFKKSEVNFGCYTLEKVNSFLPNEEFTIHDLLSKEITLKDKFWFVCNNCDLTDK